MGEKAQRLISASFMPVLTLVLIVSLEASGFLDRFVAASPEDKKSVLLGAGLCAVAFWLFTNFANRFGGDDDDPVSCQHVCSCAEDEPDDEYQPLRRELGFDAVEMAIAHSPKGSSPHVVGQLARELSGTSRFASTDIEQVARHEAAHAVVAWALGATISRASVEAENHSGFVVHVFPLDLAPQDRLWADIATYVAGNVMDQSRGVQREDSWSDFNNVLNFAVRLMSIGVKPSGYDGDLALDALVGEATRRVEGILAEHAGLVERVSASLVATNMLDAHGFLELIDAEPDAVSPPTSSI